MKPIKVTDGVYWVGAVDWNIRDFHGYATSIGTTYNAFLILDEKITLIDTVKKEHIGQMMSAISTLINPSDIDYIISNHSELDHSGCIPDVLNLIGPDKPVYCSKMGFKNLSGHFHGSLNLQAVADASTLSIGKRTLTFLDTRMLHWPDNMVTYSAHDKVLFSSDAFGQHIAAMHLFDDETSEPVMLHARKYYANIILPYSVMVTKTVNRIKELGLEIDCICPDHGIMWRKDPMSIINAYAKWAKQEPTKKAVIIYDTMWESTRMMAESIASGVSQQGVEVKPLRLRSVHRSDIITDVMDAGAVVIGSPTLNNGLFPTVSDFLSYMNGLKPKNKMGAVFGSYGWSGEATKIIRKTMDGLKFEMIADPLSIKWVPDNQGLEDCFDLGTKIGRALNKL